MSPADSHGWGKGREDLIREFEELVQKRTTETLDSAREIKKRRTAGELDEPSLPPEEKSIDDLVALAVSYGSPQNVPAKVCEALDTVLLPQQEAREDQLSSEEFDTIFFRKVLDEAFEGQM